MTLNLIAFLEGSGKDPFRTHVVLQCLHPRDVASLCITRKQVWDWLRLDEKVWRRVLERLRFFVPVSYRELHGLVTRLPAVKNSARCLDVLYSKDVRFASALSAADFSHLCQRLAGRNACYLLKIAHGLHLSESDLRCWDVLGERTPLASLTRAICAQTKPASLGSLQLSHLNAPMLKNLDLVFACASLRYLDLSGNAIACCSRLLLSPSKLQSLDLSNNDIVDCSPLGEALATNRTLEVLYLNNNKIVTCAGLALGLAANRRLEVLELSHNPIAEFAPLDRALEQNRRLRYLYLAGTKLQVPAIAEKMYKMNPRLQIRMFAMKR